MGIALIRGSQADFVDLIVRVDALEIDLRQIFEVITGGHQVEFNVNALVEEFPIGFFGIWRWDKAAAVQTGNRDPAGLIQLFLRQVFGLTQLG